MTETTISQLSILLIFIISGLAIGIFFDIFRILRKTFKTPDWLTYLEDMIFWIGTGIILLFTLFKFNNGQIRSYNIIGIIIGIVMYILLISSFFIKVSVKILTIIKNIVFSILNFLTYPIKIVLKLLKKPISFLVINIKKITKIPTKIIKNLEKDKNVEKSDKKIKKKKDFRKECRKV